MKETEKKELEKTVAELRQQIDRLEENNLVENKKYGEIKLTKYGEMLGEYFLYRHKVLSKFLKIINKDEYDLKQVEKIEHFVDEVTVKNIDKFRPN